jgi:formamidopyrimidine-DNA glycosylase
MPESPEVAFIAKEMHSKFAGRKVTSINILGGRYKKHGPPQGFHAFTQELPACLTKVDKKGKVLFFEFSNGWYMVSRLGLTGWWYDNKHLPEWKSSPHTSVAFHFGIHDQMVYDDQLSYGTLVFCQKEEADKQRAEIAPDIMDKSTTWSVVKPRISKLHNPKPIEDVLADQSAIVSGVGNYLKSEILYKARIAPMRLTDTLSEDDWKRIFRAAKSVTSRMEKVVGQKDEASYEKSMHVYMKQHDRNGNPVQAYTSKRTGRRTYWVPPLQI